MPPPTFRAQMRGMMRARILEAAWERLLRTGWDQVKMSDIARDVGVSRQTVHNEFGTKDQLAQAILDHEMEAHLSEILELTWSAPSLELAVRTSLTWVVESARGHELLRRVIADASAGRSARLLALITTESQAVIRPVRQALTEVYLERWGGEQAEVERLMDLMVRLAMSVMLLPSDFDDATMVEDIVQLVTARIHTLADSERSGPPRDNSRSESVTTPQVPPQRSEAKD